MINKLTKSEADMQKIYFVVGDTSTIAFKIADDLENSYRSKGERASVKIIGKPEKLENFELRSPEETLENISEIIRNHDNKKALVFVGWRTVAHIEEIYSTYKNSATFIFTDGTIDAYSDRRLVEPYVSNEKIDNIIILQKQKIAEFLTNNSITLDYKTVTTPVFNKDRILNISNSGVRIAIIGSL